MKFNTTERPTYNGTQGGNNGPPLLGGLGTRIDDDSSTCSCSFLDFPCYILRSCWGTLVGAIATLLVIFVLLVLLCKFGPCLIGMLKPRFSVGKKRPKRTKKLRAEEMEEFSDTSSLAVGRAPSPASTPQKGNPAASKKEQLQLEPIPGPPLLSSTSVNDLVKWSEGLRIVYLNISREQLLTDLKHYAGEHFSVAGLVQQPKLGLNVEDPWEFELSQGFEYQRWYLDASGSTKEITAPLQKELPRCFATVLSTEQACQNLSKTPRYPCINRELPQQSI